MKLEAHHFPSRTHCTLQVWGWLVQGCGFVTFALPEDAERAIRDINGKSLGGRTVQARPCRKHARPACMLSRRSICI